MASGDRWLQTRAMLESINTPAMAEAATDWNLVHDTLNTVLTSLDGPRDDVAGAGLDYGARDEFLKLMVTAKTWFEQTRGALDRIQPGNVLITLSRFIDEKKRWMDEQYAGGPLGIGGFPT